jgi:hypothetical protein
MISENSSNKSFRAFADKPEGSGIQMRFVVLDPWRHAPNSIQTLTNGRSQDKIQQSQADKE